MSIVFDPRGEQALAVLRQIADMPRRTREQQLAFACVRFLDSLEQYNNAGARSDRIQALLSARQLPQNQDSLNRRHIDAQIVELLIGAHSEPTS